MIAEMLSVRSGAACCWLGNAGWLISDGTRLIAFDLDLNSGPRSQETGVRLERSPISAQEIAPALDVQFITHEHEDHFNGVTSGILARESRCQFVVPADCVEKARSIGVRDECIRIARPDEPFDLPGLHVAPLRAYHGNREAVCPHDVVNDCGYVLTLGGVRFLQPGDSLLKEHHLRLRDIDVLFVSPTFHNMHVGLAATLINTLRPRYVFPQHFDTYVQTEDNRFWTLGYPDQLRDVLAPQSRQHYHRLRQGEVFVIE
jgi:L-ascorbate metabolism protein UlaG (beta-lactamase superfamily)